MEDQRIKNFYQKDQNEKEYETHNDINIHTINPQETKNFENEQEEFKAKLVHKDDVKNNLKKIFYNYGQYLVKESVYVLSYQNLMKILKQTEIFDGKIVKTADIDIMVKKASNKGTRLTENEFLNFFVLLCEKIDPDLFAKSRKVCIDTIYKNFIEPFCNYIDSRKISVEEMNSGSFLYKGIEDFIEDFNYCSYQSKIMNDIMPTITEIYKAYYHYELNSYNDINKVVEGSLKSTIEFAKDFEIVPFCVSFNQLIIYYNIVISKKADTKNMEVLNNSRSVVPEIEKLKDIGKVFKLSNMVEMLIVLSELSFKRLTYSSFSDMDECERILVFLEKIQSSKGFNNFERKVSKPHSHTTSLFPSKKLLMEIHPTVLDNFKFGNPEVNSMKQKGEEIKEIHKASSEESFTLRNVLDLNDENLKLVETKLSLLKDIFISYTRYSDKLSFMKLNYTSYLKFLKDNGLVEVSKEANLLREKVSKEELSKLNISPTKNRTYRMSILNFSDSKKGKLTETDASLIFQSLVGPKNNINKYPKEEINVNPFETKMLDNNKQTIILDRKTQVKNNVSLNRLDFYLFIKSFEMLAMKYYPSTKLNQAFKQFFETDLKKTFENRKSISIIYSQKMLHALKATKDEKILALIQLLHDPILPMYQNYCDNGGYMSFEQIFEFYKDFELFPDIVNLIQLKNIFFTLAESLSVEANKASESKLNQSVTSKSKGKFKYLNLFEAVDDPAFKRNLTKNEYINFPLFLESLAFSAMFFEFEVNFTNVDKLLYIVERMNHSQGVKKSQSKSGKTL